MGRDLIPIRHEIVEMAGHLFEVVGIPFEQTSELQRQVLAAFAFGMTHAVGQLNHLSPPEVHALAIFYLADVFRYADHQAAAFAESLIAAASNCDHHPTMNAIIHRGIEGHRQWQQQETGELRANIEEIFRAVGKARSAQRCASRAAPSLSRSMTALVSAVGCMRLLWRSA